ncbi:universal stress protein [Knoellia locipacati]|uniref:universal stress protein n=1 Tax=Knoellia locipacati TaxID=882824 RepID=UPI00384C26F9
MSTQTPRPVVVGYDDSPAGELALEWAVREADRLDRPLKVVVARGMLWSTSPGFGPAVPWPEDLDQQLVARAKEHVASLSPRCEVTTESIVGTPAAVLVTESDDAELVVVGRRHHSKLGELVEGSTSAQVVAHASCPVVVADRQAPSGADAPVVVAVDGSAANEPALAFAFERAASVAAPVVAVHSWTLDVPDTFDTAWLSAEHIVELESHEQKVLDDALAPWVAKFPELEVRKVLRRNLPVESVLEKADNAQMIVVGSRGHGGFVGLLLGSVSQGLLHRDRPCPLAVVHAERSES